MSDPLFPFGYGLSYTTFSIGNAQISKTKMSKNESVDLSVPVTNTGKRDGTEIVQVYVRKVNDSDGPLKSLRGFQRVDVVAGKTSQATITLRSSAFEFFDRSSFKMNSTAGDYEVLYGTSSDNKDLKSVKVTLE
jgi:beta-glucosidase